ncbi:O-antigen/teichoic acid export membrane protein [Novosphingobium sp. PhB165]|uniref:lipopolysaccharide biosynthesis protein n=1 Tax=Novosphingobium sp. PhB165 TaxID=2485105 RepID=UPI001044F1D2|nr:lipopolysaccharide biosynthesis protein [Novosphingobium sp. PhB165]TCM21366.1 O-antigen/teichoic acid export membrane protein [Novosphingobium sp. PhB165]
MTDRGNDAGEVTLKLPIAGRLWQSWCASTLIRPRIVSMAHLLSGNFGSGMLMVAALSLATHGLGKNDFGVMVVVLSIGRVCERLVRFESWQPLVRFVAAEEANGSVDRLARLYAYGLKLDLASALIAGLLAIGLAQVAGKAFGLGKDHVGLVAIYALAIICNPRGMASAALRLGGRFRTLAYVQLASSLFRLGFSVVLLHAHAGLVAFVALWTAAQILDSLLFNALGFQALRKSGIPSPLGVSWRGLSDDFPGFLRFALSTNVSSTLRTLTHEVDTLMVGYFAGAGAAGLYYLSRRIAKFAQTAGDMIQTVIYPDLARLWAKLDRKALERLVRILQSALLVFAIAFILICMAIGHPALLLFFGDDFTDVYPMLFTQLFAVALTLHAAPSRSGLLAMNRPTYVLVVAVGSTVLFFTVALVLMPRWGAIAANYAHVAFGFSTALFLDIGLWRGLSRHRKSDAAAAETARPDDGDAHAQAPAQAPAQASTEERT